MNRTTVIAVLLSLAAAPALAANVETLKQEGAGIIKVYATALQSELKAGMEEGGPTKALDVCKQTAPAIAANASQESGWHVARTSHKPRNPASAPDEFESKVLADFLARIEKGEKAADLAYAAIVDGPDGKLFRMVKAIPTAELCLNCHGSELRPEVQAKLNDLYPQDKATGFAVGQMRGAFTLSKKLEP